MTLNVARPGLATPIHRTVRWCYGDVTVAVTFDGGRIVRTNAWLSPR